MSWINSYPEEINSDLGGKSDSNNYYSSNQVDDDAGNYFQNDYYEYEIAKDEWRIQLGEYVVNDQSQPTVLKYDPYKEFLWLSLSSGRVVGYEPASIYDYNPKNDDCNSQFHRRISYQSMKECIGNILFIQGKLIVVGETLIKLHAFGGLPIHSVTLDQILKSSGKDKSNLYSSRITCSCLISELNHGLLPSQENISSHVLIGTDNKLLLNWDHECNKSASSFEIISPSLICKNNGNVTVVGCEDGKVRILDSRFRSSKVLGTLDCHTGPLSDLDLQSNGVTLLTCGYLDRYSNFGYHQKNTFVSDPLVKVFDLRTSKVVSSLSMTLSTPNFVKIVPCNDSSDRQKILMSSTSGVIQVGDLYDNSSLQMISVPITPKQDFIVSIDVSSSGHYITACSSSGLLLQLNVGLEPETNPSINKDIVYAQLPTSVLVNPPISLHTDQESLATSYYIKPNRGNDEALASSFKSSPTLLHQRWKGIQSKKLICPQLLSKAVKRDFMASLSNPGYSFNSLFSINFSNSTLTPPYLYCDPRKNTDHNMVVKQDYDSTGVHPSNDSQEPVELSVESVPLAYRRNISTNILSKSTMSNSFDYSQYNKTDIIGLENSCSNSYTNSMIQFLFAIPAIRHFALRSQTLPFYFTNPTSLWCELGFIFHLMVTKANILQDAKSKRSESVHTISLMNNVKVSQKSKISDNSLQQFSCPITSWSFQQTLSQLSEAVALGLSDDQGNPNNLNSSINETVQIRILNFTRFIIQYLQHEIDNELRHSSQPSSRPTNSNPKISTNFEIGGMNSESSSSPIDSTFTYTISTSTVYLQSNTIDKVVTSYSHTLDLVYPSTYHGSYKTTNTSGTIKELSVDYANDSSNLDHTSTIFINFATVLWHSFQKETFMRAWCSKSEAYERCKQLRSVVKIPNIVSLLCGDTQKDWLNTTVAASLKTPLSRPWYDKNECGGSWLPVLVEIAILKVLNCASDGNTIHKFIISTLMSKEVSFQDNPVDSKLENSQIWIIFDGFSSSRSSHPFSFNIDLETHKLSEQDDMQSEWEISEFRLSAVISNITPVNESSRIAHTVLHLYRENTSANKLQQHNSTENYASWYNYNDFTITQTDEIDATTFTVYKHPAFIAYMKTSSKKLPVSKISVNNSIVIENVSGLCKYDHFSLAPYAIPASVMLLPSLSSIPCIRPQHGLSSLPANGDYVSLDAEFVSVELSTSKIAVDGQRIVNSTGRQVLARISIIDDVDDNSETSTITDQTKFNSNSKPFIENSASLRPRVLVDDYILPSEPVVDYVTRFSGITEDDLSPQTSSHALVTRRTAYLKLRFFIDRGCIFIGHGLQKDFEIANVVVSPHQIRDTVEIWRLPNQRKISLRFLASYLLQSEIQEDIHDSIEDAKTAFQLYKKYESIVSNDKSMQQYQQLLTNIYAFGVKTNWTIGLDKLDK